AAYLGSCLIIIGFGAGMRAAQQRAETSAEEANRRQKQLEQEVVERRRAEEALQQGEAQLQLVMDHAPVFIARCDTERRLQFVNKGYAGRFGLKPEEVVGRQVADVVGQQAYESFRPYVDRVLAGEPVEYEIE